MVLRKSTALYYWTSKNTRAAAMERAALCTLNSAIPLDGGAGDGCGVASGDGETGDGFGVASGDGCGVGCGDGSGAGESLFTSPFQFVHMSHSKSTFWAFFPYKVHPDPNREPVH